MDIVKSLIRTLVEHGSAGYGTDYCDNTTVFRALHYGRPCNQMRLRYIQLCFFSPESSQVLNFGEQRVVRFRNNESGIIL